MNKESIRVLHVDTEKAWGGGQQQVAYLMEHMHAQGYVTALAGSPESDLYTYCEGKNMRCYPVYIRGDLDVFAGLKIAGLCRKAGFNILHLHTAGALAAGLWARMFYWKVRLIGVRRMVKHIRRNPLSRLKYDNFLISRIVCISEQIRKVMLEDGVPDTLLETIHSGVDLHRFDSDTPPPGYRRKLGVPAKHVLAGTVASMVKVKGYATLLRAAKVVLDRTDNVTFCALGKGPELENIVSLAEELQLGDRFVFAGFRDDVGRFLKSCDIFVLPSYSEGLGSSILDAQGIGLPVIGSRVGGIPEAVLDNENGITVPPGDPDALAKAVLELAEDEERRKAFGKKALETVKRFDISHTIEKNLALYERMLADDRAKV